MGCEILNKQQEYFLQKAQENFPKLYYKTITLPEQSHLETGDSFVLDLGNHYVGKFSFKMDNVDDFIDAPTKLIIKFCEDMREVKDDFSNYKGRMSYTWLQEESLFIDYPKTVNMERRYSCRYIKITVEKTKTPIKLYDFTFVASTSANVNELVGVTTSPILQKIDEVATNTLKECMQTFFEDGPKRDRRLWIGDLRLEALTNYYTFNNLELVRRCLYLFAAGKTNSLGFVPSFVYETPYFYSGKSNIIDYALLYVVSVCDYYEHARDIDTINNLLTVCKNQLDSFSKILDDNLIVTRQEGWAFFIDWCPGLSGYVALQGVYLYTLEKFIALLKSINDNDYIKYEELLAKVRQASKMQLFNEEKGVFTHKIDDMQISVHSQVWMILGGVIEGERAQKLLISILNDKNAKKPFTPYMWHYVIEAMFKIGLKDDATTIIKEFWGGMIERGADTFYEVYVPNDPDFSPYGDRMNNSLCHAWSCTPSYFIRKYNL